MTAQEAARAAGSVQITPSHLLLGLLTELHGLAAQAITAQHTTLDNVRDTVTAALPPPGTQPPPVLIPFDTQAKHALELTLQHALRLDRNYVIPSWFIAPLQTGARGRASCGSKDPVTCALSWP